MLLYPCAERISTGCCALQHGCAAPLPGAPDFRDEGGEEFTKGMRESDEAKETGVMKGGHSLVRTKDHQSDGSRFATAAEAEYPPSASLPRGGLRASSLQ